MAFNTTFNSQLLTPQSSTPVKTEASSSVSTSTSDLTSDHSIRFLTASGPLMSHVPSLPPSLNHESLRQLAPFSYPMFPIHPLEVKPEMLVPQSGSMVPSFVYDPYSYHPYLSTLDGGRRKNATRETTAHLKNWLNEHRKNPYPTKAEKIMLALLTKMTLTQVSTWFANARRRLKKENKMTWTPLSRTEDDDDDDDFADIDNLDRDPLERASSSGSDQSESKRDFKPDEAFDRSNSQEASTALKGESSIKVKSEPQEEKPRKNKIWSIAETLEDKGTTEHKRKEEAPKTSTSSADKSEGHPREETRTTSTLNIPMTSMTPQSIFHFNQWQQQMALAMSRMPFHRSAEFFQTVPHHGFRPPMLFSPILINAAAALPTSQSVPVPPTALAQTNGSSLWNEQCVSGNSLLNISIRNTKENDKPKSS